jgi:hypothetical protein
VVGVDVGDDASTGIQVQEGRVALVGLDDDVVARAQAGVGARAVQPAADDEGRVDAGLGQHAGHQRGGGGLAVRAGDGDALRFSRISSASITARGTTGMRARARRCTSGLSAASRRCS